VKIIPSKRQWRAWSLPSKLTCIGTYVGVASLIVSIVLIFWPNTPSEGLWEVDPELLEQGQSEKLHERKRELAAEAYQLLPTYSRLREVNHERQVVGEERNQFTILMEQLFRVIAEFNRIEAKLAVSESLTPSFFSIPLVPLAPKNGRTVMGEGGPFVVFDVYADPLTEKVNQHLRQVYRQYGQAIPKAFEEGKAVSEFRIQFVKEANK